MSDDSIEHIYDQIPGGQALLDWFGYVPSFHDAEIVGLDLRRTGQSLLRIHYFIAPYVTEHEQGGSYVFEKHAVVTFALEDIMDLQLNGFSHQNVIGGLTLRRATDRGRANYYSLNQSPEDIEIELEPCYGLDGFIRAKRVSISLEPGIPEGPSVYRDRV